MEITDIKGFTVTGKLDIGVHNDLDIEQEEYCFEVAVDEKGVTMIINSKEQIFAEKLYSLLKRSTLSTRYKDIFDMHYLSAYVDKERLLFCFDKYIYSKPKRENNIEDIVNKLEQIFENKRFMARLQSSKKNWEGIELSVVINELMDFFNTLKSGVKFKEEKDDKVNMCQALKEMMEEANSEGIQKGAQEERTAMARRMLKEGGLSMEFISRMTGLSLEEVQLLAIDAV